jgi:UDP-N-acetylmuramoylalanine--D-glutamate ligase
MSSYQLETCQVSPHWAVWLNLFPEHLNYHATMQDYAAAKAHIFSFQTTEDILWYNQDSPEIAAAVKSAKGTTVGFAAELDNTQAAPLPKSYQALPSLPWWTKMVLPTTVKRFNLLPALYVAAYFDIPLDTLQKGLASFETLPHRLEVVGTYRDITFIDDTLATIPQATIAALASVSPVSVLILGGYDRGIDFAPIVDAVVAQQIPTILLFPPSGEKMLQLLHERHPDAKLTAIPVQSMQDAVTQAYRHAQPGSAVLLSPASPSFGQFKDYVDKSEQFAHWVRTLANSPVDAAEVNTT